MNIGEQIKRMRSAGGISQVELAKKVGTFQPFISAIESGRLLPSTRTLMAIAKAFKKKLIISFVDENRKG